MLGIISADFVSGIAPPCVYADAPFGAVDMQHGCSYGPMEIVKAVDESADEKLAHAAFVPRQTLRHQESVAPTPQASVASSRRASVEEDVRTRN